MPNPIAQAARRSTLLRPLRQSAITKLVLSFMHHGSADGVRLPPTALRMGGENFRADADFLAGGDRDVDRLRTDAGLDSSTRLLDLGCGPGRLAIALYRRYGCLDRYLGVDVQSRHIAWARRHLPNCFEFALSDSANERYNPTGHGTTFLPVEPGFTIAYAYSVFSHMTSSEVQGYLAEFVRVLDPGGIAWFTAFVEKDVAKEMENPPGYGHHEHTGALHVVRFERTFFESLITSAGFEVVAFYPQSDTNGQSLYVVSRGGA